MRDLKNKLTPGKSSTYIQSRRYKSFGYQVLGFGAGGSADPISGGTITTYTGYQVHTFTANEDLVISAGNSFDLDIFIVG